MRFMIVIWGDVEAQLRGPYSTESNRVRAARRHRAKHSDKDGLHRLDVHRTHRGVKVEVGDFSSYETEAK